MQRHISHDEYDYSDLDYLLKKTATGNTEALAHLYRITSTSVYAYALSILKNPHDAEDVLQDCYIRIFTYAANYQSAGKPMAWILTIARNLCRNKQQLHRCELHLGQQDWQQYIADKTNATSEDKMLIRACLEALSEEERIIVTLRSIAFMTYAEIAQYMKMPISTVLSKYHRSIKKIRKFAGEEE